MNLFKLYFSFLIPQFVDLVDSEFNDKIKVEIYRGRYRTAVGGFWQSGEYAENTLNFGLNNINTINIKNILLLGLGAGSMIGVLDKYFPKSMITGVEIDEQMVNIGKKYFNLKNYPDLKIVISDAAKFINEDNNNYDLIVSDLFVACKAPNFLISEKFISQIHNHLTDKGIFIGNFSQLQDYNAQTQNTLSNLKKIFPRVNPINKYPNLIIQAFK